MAVLYSRIGAFIMGDVCQVFKKMGMLWFVCLLMLSAIGRAEELFPVPKQIEKNVEFWTKIYSQYSTNHVVIHDKDDLGIIYKVINLNDYYPDSLNLSTKWQIVETIKDDYRRILQKLSQLTLPVNLDSLTREERYVFIIWAQSNDPYKFQKAVYGIRAQLGLRDRFKESIKRSGFFQQEFEAIFASYGLPKELTYLPHVESLYNFDAYSKVGAAGIWQFMRYTGRLFMTVDYAVDERLDPIAATDGAARLLKHNYEELQSWPLAITAYNHGLGGMQTAVQRYGTDDFGVIYENYKSNSFGFASKNFYAEFLAASHVAANSKTYFGDIETYPAIQFQSVKLQNDFFIDQLAELFKIPVDTLVAYNPAFRRSIIINQAHVPRGYNLRLPFREGFDPREALVQRTQPVPEYRQPFSSSAHLFAQLAGSDSVKTMRQRSNAEIEAYILNKLQMEPTPTLIKDEESIERQKSATLQGN